MNSKLLNSSIQDYIDANLDQNIFKLAFQKNPFQEVDWSEILNQIVCKSKAKLKLPTFFETKNILYPSKISLEQTSSEKTALYKSQLVSGENLLDLAGGFGIDDYYFSKKVSKVIYCEIDENLSKIVAHNFQQLDVSNKIECICTDSYDYLLLSQQKFDTIYIDPSRRHDSKGKVFMLKDCQPNVPELLDFYFKYSNKIIIKTAPILDITAGLSELMNVKNIHIVALDNEVKELLWEIEKDFSGSPMLKTVNISNQIEEYKVSFSTTSNPVKLSLPLRYLYEPNSAILKSGAFNQVARDFGLNKLHQHSHLYTSNEIKPFPGRVFEIQTRIGYTKNEMRAHLENTKANITTRNFPDKVDQIREKWNIKDGGKKYCFFTTDLNENKIALICKKIETK